MSCIYCKGRAQRGIRCYRRALALVPHYDIAWNNLGVALEQTGDPAGASAAFARALDAAPQRTTYLVNRASALSKTGRRSEAAAHLARALELEPDLRVLLDSMPELGRLLRGPRKRPRIRKRND